MTNMQSSRDYLVNSVVILAPAHIKKECDEIARMMGWGDDSFSVPLSSDGSNITHYGLRSECNDIFIGWLRGIDLPWAFNPALLQPVLDAIIVDVSPDLSNPSKPTMWGSEHFDYVCKINGMSRL